MTYSITRCTQICLISAMVPDTVPPSEWSLVRLGLCISILLTVWLSCKQQCRWPVARKLLPLKSTRGLNSRRCDDAWNDVRKGREELPWKFIDEVDGHFVRFLHCVSFLSWQLILYVMRLSGNCFSMIIRAFQSQLIRCEIFKRITMKYTYS